MITIHLGTLPYSLSLQNASFKIICFPMDPEEKWATLTSLGFVKERHICLGRLCVLWDLRCCCEQGVERSWDWLHWIIYYIKEQDKLQVSEPVGQVEFLFLSHHSVEQRKLSTASGEWFPWHCWESLVAGAWLPRLFILLSRCWTPPERQGNRIEREVRGGPPGISSTLDLGRQWFFSWLLT